MLNKTQKKLARKLLAKIEPKEKVEILFGGLEEEVKEIGSRVSATKDYSDQILWIQHELESLKEEVVIKIEGTNESVENVKQFYLENLYSIEEKLSSLIKGAESDVSKIDLGLIEERKERQAIEKTVRNLEELVNTLRNTINSRGGGSIPLQVSAGGVFANKTYAEINFVGATAVTNNTTKKTDITTSGGSSSGFQLPLSGAVDGSNQAYTWTTAPNVIVVDGAPLQKVDQNGDVNWTLVGVTTTLTFAPTRSIFAIA